MTHAHPPIGLLGKLSGPIMRRLYSDPIMRDRICVSLGLGPHIYLNRHQEALTCLQVTVRNRLPFKLRFEPISLMFSCSSRQIERVISAQRFVLERAKGEITLSFDDLKLSKTDVNWIRGIVENCELFPLNSRFFGDAYFKTWFGEFKLPISLVASTTVDSRPA